MAVVGVLLMLLAVVVLVAAQPSFAEFVGSGSSVDTTAANAQQGRSRFLAPQGISPRQFPRSQSFSANIALHPQALAQFAGKVVDYKRYSNMTLAFDVDRRISELAFLQTGFPFLGPKYAALPNKEFWTPDGGSLIANYGAVCLNGSKDLRTDELRYLWEELAAGKGMFVGDAQVGGQSCEQWEVSDVALGNMSMCVGADGVPRSLVIEAGINAVGATNVVVGSFNMTFHDIRTGDASGASELRLEVCPKADFRACGGGGSALLQALRFTSGEPWGHFEDRDFFDWDAFPVMAGEFAGGHKYLSTCQVEANTSYGPWRECDYNSVKRANECTELPGDVASLVSRVSAEILMGSPEDLMGQCGANEVSGSWFVFPHQGECGEGQAIGDQGCTWKVKDWKVVTVEDVFARVKSEFGLDVTNASAMNDAMKKESPPFPRLLHMFKVGVAKSPAVGVQIMI